jgi:hypothetical protein
VNADATFRHDFENFTQPNLARVANLQGTACNVAAIMDGENDRMKSFSIGAVEGTINEDA